MKLVLYSYTFLALMMSGVSCKKDKNKDNYASFEEIPSDKYYPTDMLNASHTDVYGSWIVYGTSGGFSGQGYTPDFNKLLIKPNGIFGIIRNDSLITYGKIVIQSQTAQELFVEFIPETTVNGIDILSDREKYITVRNNDTLDLTAPCCDRFNTHLKRQ